MIPDFVRNFQDVVLARKSNAHDVVQLTTVMNTDYIFVCLYVIVVFIRLNNVTKLKRTFVRHDVQRLIAQSRRFSHSKKGAARNETSKGRIRVFNSSN